ncbi:hypothetical protein [Corynebacterium sp. CCUG 51687]|uniref:hypothetical protein n=1 Tax=Corynebacterium sp. CCUG 51687 TaxID=2823897 RepID=UPI00210BE84E|nr:hypothetical protein [Corynebacterium sp. CCUG 51687]MCQ4611898.1 hypothetical protein [Corynebacterium sp. CCUG 51687]
MEDLVMPYGVTIETNSDGGSSIVGDHPQKIGVGSLKLVPGPCRVVLSWGGPTKCQLVLATKGERLTVAEVPSGGGGPRSTMVTVGAREGDAIYARLFDAQPGQTGTMEVYPMPAT